MLCCLFFSAISHSQTFRKLDFKANDIVYSARQNSLYASAPSANKMFGNCVCRIDPTTGAVTKSVYVGTEPSCLAVSDDGQFLYIGLELIPRIIRLKLPDMIPDLTIQLQDTLGFIQEAIYAEEIKILPTKPNSIAVIVGGYSSPSFQHIAIYDNAVQRPNVGYDRIYLGYLSSMTFIGTNPDTLIGMYTGYDTYIIPINNQGVVIPKESLGNRTSYYDKYFKYSTRDSLIYSGINIINPRSVNPRLKVIHSFGFLDFPNVGNNSAVIAEPDPFTNALFFTYFSNGKLLLKRYNSITRLLNQEWTLADKTAEIPRQIINLGKAEKLAVLSNNFIFLLDNMCISTISTVP